MQECEKELREVAKKLLLEKKVDLIIGYEEGTLPLRTRPIFIREADETKKLVWNSRCENSLCSYLKTTKERVGIVAKGCDSRSIIGLIKERQIKRENIFIIGVPCSGIIDRKKIEDILEGRELLECIESDSQITLKGEGLEEKVDKDKLVHASCKSCKYRNPVLYDTLVGKEVSQGEVEEYSDVEEFASKSDDERWAYFNDEASRCIRCYACRNVCPACYCPQCFVDQSLPTWFGRTLHPSDTLMFHMIRTLHIAGRCVDCGACSRVCPVNIELRMLHKKVQKDVKELYDYEAGINLEELPPMATFKMDDPQEFIK
ncbi:4Fe-4S ferredoxin [Candidatus Aerophobetes bacterium Ae_b3a]|nr:MAG: 4Fe-4S ferredoxin [Candidatus Aerophobetes bacterium Ae_b3a]